VEIPVIGLASYAHGLTVLKAACALINLAWVWVHIHLCFHCSSTLAVNAQLIHASPFTPAAPSTSLTWLVPGVTAVMVLTSTGRLLLLYISKTSRDFTAFLRNVFEGGSLLLYVPKMSPYFCYFSLRNYNFGNTVGQYQEF
jgi:hypothetical protein